MRGLTYSISLLYWVKNIQITKNDRPFCLLFYSMSVCFFILQYAGMLFCFTICRYVVLFYSIPVCCFISQYTGYFYFTVCRYVSCCTVYQYIGFFFTCCWFFLQYAGMLSLILCVEVAGCTLGVVFKSSVI